MKKDFCCCSGSTARRMDFGVGYVCVVCDKPDPRMSDLDEMAATHKAVERFDLAKDFAKIFAKEWTRQLYEEVAAVVVEHPPAKLPETELADIDTDIKAQAADAVKWAEALLDALEKGQGNER